MNALRNLLYSHGRSSIVGMDGDMGANEEALDSNNSLRYSGRTLVPATGP